MDIFTCRALYLEKNLMMTTVKMTAILISYVE